MSVTLICDNCGQTKLLSPHCNHRDWEGWDWIDVRVGDSAYAFGQLAIRRVYCPDCLKAADKAREQAGKEALAIRAVKGLAQEQKQP